MSYYRDTLIAKDGKPGREITRGTSGGYQWSVTADTSNPGRVLVSVRRTGERAYIDLEKIPNYVSAEILQSIASTI